MPLIYQCRQYKAEHRCCESDSSQYSMGVASLLQQRLWVIDLTHSRAQAAFGNITSASSESLNVSDQDSDSSDSDIWSWEQHWRLLCSICYCSCLLSYSMHTLNSSTCFHAHALYEQFSSPYSCTCVNQNNSHQHIPCLHCMSKSKTIFINNAHVLYEQIQNHLNNINTRDTYLKQKFS